VIEIFDKKSLIGDIDLCSIKEIVYLSSQLSEIKNYYFGRDINVFGKQFYCFKVNNKVVSFIIYSNNAINVNGTINNIWSSTSIGSVIGRWYKLLLTVSNYVSGSCRLELGIGYNTPLVNANGTYTYYAQATANNQQYITASGQFTIDNVSVQEIGWSGSQELYDGIYAQTAGTVEQKTYAAVKAASMWCHYNNDPQLGIIYGKLYNWFAVKLLQMDIDYYNAANPTTPWGYRVPTDSDFNTLATTLGGNSIAGGKMKMIGTNYFISPNTGATNESGFSALGSGYRSSVGLFIGNKASDAISTITSVSPTQLKSFDANYNLSSFLSYDTNFIYGLSLRLIRQ